MAGRWGDGYCDDDLNTPECAFDGSKNGLRGDCCPDEAGQNKKWYKNCMVCATFSR